ncbi:hypothetical protein niasHS_006688 [Heterodera schachtii]|uniref:Bacterial surface antigen (D15) domain-containing protein n=1 Tax=Heterodera schachtii TaxID=97005 RepID=A0ABD2JHZ7_HETSC
MEDSLLDAETFLYKCSHHNVAADSIEFHGVKTTRTDALKKEVAELFRANNLHQLIQNSGKAAIHMMEMGLFEECQAMIDTAPGIDNGEQKYVVKFFAKELKNAFKMNIKMEMQTSGETDAGLSAKKANIFGRGETAELTFSKGLRKDGGYSFGFSALKPLLGWQRYENIGAQIHKRSDFLKWNKADTHESAASFTFNKYFPEYALMSSFGFNSNWRSFLTRNDTPFPIREHSGHTTKFSFDSTLLSDGRDRPILPTKGSLFKLRTEYAPGAVGDSAFLKGIFDFQTAAPLPGGLFCGASFRLGAVHPTANRGIHLLDRLYLGGPFDVRGYELNSIGATKESGALGGSTLLSTAVHLYAPLIPKDMFFAHFFVTAGSLSPMRSKHRLYDLWELQRVSAGLGLAVNLMNMVRLELNYTFPLRKLPGDVCFPGIQIGAGLNFM